MMDWSEEVLPAFNAFGDQLTEEWCAFLYPRCVGHGVLTIATRGPSTRNAPTFYRQLQKMRIFVSGTLIGVCEHSTEDPGMHLNETSAKFDRSVSMLCWAYNEKALMGDFLKKADALLAECIEDYEIIVIDDGSTDQTNAIVKKMMQEIPRIKLITNQSNRNVGYCLQLAVRSATKEYLFWQTVDWSYDISMLRRYLECLKSHDIVLGVRSAPVPCKSAWLEPILYVLRLFGIKHLTRRSDTVGKAVISVINYTLIRFLYGVPLSDFQNVVFYPTRLVQSIHSEARAAFANPELLIKAYWSGASIKEVPINFIPRQAGEAKGTKPKALFTALWDVVSLWFKWVVLGRERRSGTGTVSRLRPVEWASPCRDKSGHLINKRGTA